jgi:hypothetical protein
VSGALLFVALAGCEERAADTDVVIGLEAPDTTTVTITGDTLPLNIDPDPVYVRRGSLVEWSHSGVDSFEIDLRRVPMVPVLIRGRPGANARAIVPQYAPDDTFKYSITVFVNGEGRTEDPRIICCGDAPGDGD